MRRRQPARPLLDAEVPLQPRSRRELGLVPGGEEMAEAMSEDEKERENLLVVPVGPGPGAKLIDRVLLLVRLERQRQDDLHGILRDYRDGTAGTRFHGPASQTDRAGVLE